MCTITSINAKRTWLDKLIYFMCGCRLTFCINSWLSKPWIRGRMLGDSTKMLFIKCLRRIVVSSLASQAKNVGSIPAGGAR